MKKFIVLLVTVFGVLFMSNVKAQNIELPEKTDHEKVTVYLFRGAGCSHCYDFLEYFAKNYAGYEDYFEIVAYESWNNTTNQKLMLNVKKLVGEKENTSVPFIVIGDNYHLLGFGADSGEEIIKTALEEYQNNSYTDIVTKSIKDNKIEPTAETLKKAAESEGIAIKEDKTNKDTGLSDTVVVAIVFGVIILGFAGLVVLSRKK